MALEVRHRRTIARAVLGGVLLYSVIWGAYRWTAGNTRAFVIGTAISLYAGVAFDDRGAQRAKRGRWIAVAISSIVLGLIASAVTIWIQS